VGKLVSILIAVGLQLAGIAGAHFYYSANPRDAIVVVDSSYGLKEYQTQINDWIDDYSNSQRYTDIHFATDKSYLGEGTTNKDKLFRVSFGKMNVANLAQIYTASKYEDRILLTFTGQDVSGWEVVEFSN